MEMTMKMGAALALWLVCGIGLVSSGCVMKEQYEAEKTRALNFQRLLAQEEKRTGELDAEAKRLKRDLPELEAKNRELTAQLQAVREQAGRIKEENDALRESTAIKAKEEMNRSLDAKPKSRSKAMPKVSPSKADKPAQPAEPEPADPLAFEKPFASSEAFPDMDKGSPIYHHVKPGETLFRVSRQYGVQVDQIKEWNHLRDTIIEVGQKLIVGYQ
jgi:Skp family chaperone for outer membrane proteins